MEDTRECRNHARRHAWRLFIAVAWVASGLVIAFARTGVPVTNAVRLIRYNVADEQLVDFGDAIKAVKLNTKGLDFIANTPAIATGRGGRGVPPTGVISKKSR